MWCNRLFSDELSDRIQTVTLNERVRQRLREEKDKAKLSERDVADLIQWTQSKVAQKLGGRTPITLDELEALCFALSLNIAEAVRDRGYEFYAELAPYELRMLERVRRMPKPHREAVLTLIGLQPDDLDPNHKFTRKKR